MTIAVPLSQGRLSQHFGHCEQFALFEVQDGEITARRTLNPPRHEPGVLPRWLHEQGAEVIIAGGLGRRAQGLFQQAGIKVVYGAEARDPREVVEAYLRGDLVLGENICDH